MLSRGKRGERVNVKMPECWTIRTVLKQDKLPLLYLISVGIRTGECQHSLSWGSLEQIRWAQWHGKRGQRGLPFGASFVAWHTCAKTEVSRRGVSGVGDQSCRPFSQLPFHQGSRASLRAAPRQWYNNRYYDRLPT